MFAGSIQMIFFPMLTCMTAEMPTSWDLNSGDFSFTAPWYLTTPPPPPKEKSDDPLLPIKWTSIPPNRLRASNVHLNLAAGKEEKDFLS